MTKRWKQGCERKSGAFKGEVEEEGDSFWELHKKKRQRRKKLG